MTERQPELDARIPALRAHLIGLPGAVGAPLATPKGVMLYKVMGKMFAILEDRAKAYLILKCDPHLAEILREQYAAIGHRSHLDRRFWIAIDLGGDVPDDEVARLAAASYDLVRAGLTKRQKAELDALDH